MPPRWMFAVMLPPQDVTVFGRTYLAPPVVGAATTIVAINVGGALLPLILSLYLFARSSMRARMLVGVALVAALVHAGLLA